jgi:deoxyribonuclease V
MAIQESLRRRVARSWTGGEIRRVLAADVSFPAGGKLARAAVVVVDFPDMTPLEWRVGEGPVTFPYVPGLLAFREVPAILGALGEIKEEVDVILCDGQGLAHPRGMGLATHLGLWLGIPTIGCAKSRLYGLHDEPGMEKGSRRALRDSRGRTIGCVLRTRTGVRPVYVSVGHRIDLRRAVGLVLQCSPHFRIPEPLRLADKLAGGKEISRG